MKVSVSAAFITGATNRLRAGSTAQHRRNNGRPLATHSV